jgi:hypothetical protein
MTEQFLNSSNIIPCLQKMRGKRVTECMTSDRLEDAGKPGGGFHSFLNGALA